MRLLLPLSAAWAGLAIAGPALAVERWVEVPDAATMARTHALGLGFLEQSEGRWLRFSASPESAAALAASGLNWRVAEVPPPSDLDAEYHSPDEMEEALRALAAAHPDRARLVQMGVSVEGRPLLALQLGAWDAPQLQWRVLGAHHGDERPSGELALALAQTLLSADGADPDRTALLDRDSIWIWPQVNPDGMAAGRRNNSRGVDLNRNYDFQWAEGASGSGGQPFSEPETRAVAALSAWTGLGAGLSLHAGATNLGWVWNYSTTAPPDEPLVADMAARFAELCTQSGFWITNGADWYRTYGDTNDWSYGRYGTLDFTLELSVDKSPPGTELDALLARYLPASLDFFAWGPRVAGQLLDADSGRPIPGTVIIDGGQPLVTGPDGRFGRPVAPGDSVSLTLSAPGYQGRSLVVARDGDAGPLALSPLNLAPLRPSAPLLSQGGEGCLLLEGAAADIRLVRPGQRDQLPQPDGDCALALDLTAMLPGPWTLVVDGQVGPRSVFIGEIDDRVQILDVDHQGDHLWLEGAGFGEGSQAWAFWGVDRSPVALTVLSEDGERIALDVGEIPDLDEPVDLLLWSAGAQLAVVDAFAEAAVDETPPEYVRGGTADTGGGQDPGALGPVSPIPPAPAGCGCAAPLGPRSPPLSPALPLLALLGAAARWRKS